MHVSFSDIFNLYQFPSGRLAFALDKCLVEAKALELPELIQRLESAIAHQDITLDAEIARDSARLAKSQHGPAAKALDARVDSAFSALHDSLQAQIRMFGADSEPGRHASTIINQSFRSGVHAITQLPFVEQHERVSRIVIQLQDSDGETGLAKNIAALGLGPMVNQLGVLNEDYGKHLQLASPEQLESSTIESLRSQGQLHLLQVIAAIVGLFPNGDEDSTQRRNRLLTPIFEQQQALRDARRRRRRLTDVDPETGADIEIADEAEAVANID